MLANQRRSFINLESTNIFEQLKIKKIFGPNAVLMSVVSVPKTPTSCIAKCLYPYLVFYPLNNLYLYLQLQRDPEVPGYSSLPNLKIPEHEHPVSLSKQAHSVLISFISLELSSFQRG